MSQMTCCTARAGPQPVRKEELRVAAVGAIVTLAGYELLFLPSLLLFSFLSSFLSFPSALNGLVPRVRLEFFIIQKIANPDPTRKETSKKGAAKIFKYMLLIHSIDDISCSCFEYYYLLVGSHCSCFASCYPISKPEFQNKN